MGEHAKSPHELYAYIAKLRAELANEKAGLEAGCLAFVKVVRERDTLTASLAACREQLAASEKRVKEVEQERDEAWADIAVYRAQLMKGMP